MRCHACADLETCVTSGVDNGSRLRVRGEGNAGRKGGEPGDLYVFISVRGHSKLRREGTTIHADVDISYIDAILGTTVEVWHPALKRDVNITGVPL